MLKHAAEASSPLPPAQMPGPKDGCTFQCDQCENNFNSQRKFKKHKKTKYPNLQKPEELCDIELDKSLNLSVASEERCNTSLSVTHSLVKLDKVSDQELYDLFCSFRRVWILKIQTPCIIQKSRRKNLVSAISKQRQGTV